MLNPYISYQKAISSLILLLTTFSYQSLLLFVTPVSAQTSQLCAIPGRDGPARLSGIINTYYPGGSTVSAGTKNLTLGAINSNGATTPIAAGDLLLVIQMQGADINSSNNDAYGDGVAGGGNNTNTSVTPAVNGASGNLNNANFIAGNYEYVVATGPITGASVPIQGKGAGGGLINTYTNAPFSSQGQRTYQIIRVPQYASASVNSTLTAAPWNGSSGGVLVYDVAGDLNLGGATIDVSAKGFRGGGGRQLNGGTGANTDYVTLSTDTANGSKGEGIAGTPRFVLNPATNLLIDNGVANEGYPDGSYGRGAPGTAGGGSTDGKPNTRNNENSGGGGGANGGTGGIGGRSWSSEIFIGGFGGASFPATTNRVVLGGGGGAGASNNGTIGLPGAPSGGLASSGAPGGGMVLMRIGSVSGSGTINANGGQAFDVANDSGGGGGGGGSSALFKRQRSHSYTYPW